VGGDASPHFSPALYCGGGSGHVYYVALGRAPRRTVEYACGALGRASCIHARLRRLATIPGEKSGLGGLAAMDGRGGYYPIRLRAALQATDSADCSLSNVITLLRPFLLAA